MTAGAVVGICAGIAAVALRLSLASVLEFLQPYRQYAWAFILPGIGALLSFLFLDKVMREGAGHGVPEVIYAVSRRGGAFAPQIRLFQIDLQFSDHCKRRVCRP